MSKISRLKRLEEALAQKQKQKELEADRALHQEILKKHAQAHKGTVTLDRRTFLESGVLSMSAYVLGPTILGMVSGLSESARAQVLECPVPVTNGGPAPFINLHLSGGFQTLSSATPRTTAGARLGSYIRLGLGANPTFVNNVFANQAELFDVPTAGQGFLKGLRAGAQATTLSNAALVTVPIRDNGDSEQRFSILGLVERAGRAGTKLAYLRNGGNADTGINGTGAFNIVTKVNPTNIGSTQALLNSVNLTGALARLSAPQQQKLARTIQNLNAEQASRITGLNGGQEMARLVHCATDQNIKNLAGGGPVLDPAQVTGMPAIWGNNFANVTGPGSGSFNMQAIAAITNNVLNGNAAGAAINVGGFDIHANGDRPRTDQEIGAFNIGLTVGRMLESARLLNSKLFIHITTNGSVVNAGGTLADRFNNDDNNGNCFGASHFIMYDPAAPVTTTSALPQQIGGLTANGNVDNTQFTSVVEVGEAAAFYNYMVFSGLEGQFDRAMAGLRTFSAAEKAMMRKKA